MLRLIDLFAGMGGLATGFAKEGYSVKGFDINSYVKKIFENNRIGKGVVKDLSQKTITKKAEVLTGGPPCRPWSCINITRRKEEHPDYKLLDVFFEHVSNIEPAVFLLENVLPLKTDKKFQKWLDDFEKAGFSVGFKVIRYSDFGASTSRRRLFVVGFSDGSTADEFFSTLENYWCNPRTVGEAIEQFAGMEKGEYPDHEWPRLRTIERYEKYYKTGKYGWYKLDFKKPAPSFGNVMKTYILHPLAGMDGMPSRVISVREAMAIMGFDSEFYFPKGMGLSTRYQMVADAVSPIVSNICAKAIKNLLEK